MGHNHGASADVPVVAAPPAAPPAPYVSVYAKADNKVYGLDSAGVERMLSANPVTVADETVPITGAATQIGFQGAGVAVEPWGADTAVVTVAGFVEHTPGARIHLPADISLASSTTATVLPLSVAEYDQPVGFADPATGSLVIPQDGLYMVTAYVEMSGGTVTGGFAVGSLCYDSGAGKVLLRSMRIYPTQQDSLGLVMSCNKKFRAGTKLLLQAAQNSGAARTVEGDVSKTCIEAAFIGPF